MTSNEEKDIDTHQCQTQIDEDLTMNVTTKLPVIKLRSLYLLTLVYMLHIISFRSELTWLKGRIL